MSLTAAGMNTCGCAKPPRRKCGACRPERGVFLACSRRCLDAHARKEHPAGVTGDATAGARTLITDGNRDHARNWELYEGHRTRITALVKAAQRAEGLCVLGAGNCDDIDLAAFLTAFGNVHLVDIDDEALGRGIARLPTEGQRRRVSRGGGIDLCGYLGDIDAWGEELPPMGDLLARASATADATVAAIGAGPFDVVLSSCLLSQLWIPMKRTLVLNAGEWRRIFTLIITTHLLTMARLTRPGGTAVLATEVASVDREPELLALGAPGDREQLAAAAQQRFAAGLVQEPETRLLLTIANEYPELAALKHGAHLVDPWLWRLGDRTQINYAILFRRADD